MKTILLVFGTRPEAIKMCPVVLELRKEPALFRALVCVTGQHREMLDQVLEIFGIIPDFDLNIMRPGQDLFDITSGVLIGMRKVLRDIHPDIVLVHGDTTTSMAAALAAFYEHIPVGHVEAGLRTNNIYNPWPEEMNRQITGRIASLNFVPTVIGEQNLQKEDAHGKTYITGNTVIDALKQVVKRIDDNSVLRKDLEDRLYANGYDVSRNRRIVLITGHRRESFGDGFRQVLSGISSLVDKYSDVDFVYPVHRNPQVRKHVEEVFGPKAIPGHDSQREKDNLFFIEPLDYLEFVFLMSKSYLILTDSGGIQEEAPSLGIPVLVMRETTERPEAVSAGTVRLVGTDYDRIVNETSILLDDNLSYEIMARATNPYGDGEAAKRIVTILRSL